MNITLNSNRLNHPLLRGEICPAKHEQLTNRGVSLLRGPARPGHSGWENCPAKNEQACTERSEARATNKSVCVTRNAMFPGFNRICLYNT